MRQKRQLLDSQRHKLKTLAEQAEDNQAKLVGIIDSSAVSYYRLQFLCYLIAKYGERGEYAEGIP